MSIFIASGKKVDSTELTTLDQSILSKCKDGKDIVSLLSNHKPYIGKGGNKVFASTLSIKSSVRKLLKSGLLERR